MYTRVLLFAALCILANISDHQGVNAQNQSWVQQGQCLPPSFDESLGGETYDTVAQCQTYCLNHPPCACIVWYNANGYTCYPRRATNCVAPSISCSDTNAFQGLIGQYWINTAAMPSSMTSVSLSVPFTPAFSPSQTSYSSSVASTVPFVGLVGTFSAGNATVSFTGAGGVGSVSSVSVLSGAPTQSFTLSSGNNILTLRYTSNTGVLTTYTFAITKAAAIHGDPQIVGFRGQSFEFHGIPDEVFNIFSSPLLQVHSLFTFLKQGRNLDLIRKQEQKIRGDIDANRTQLPSTQSWTHPGTYLSNMGFKLFDKSSNPQERDMEARILLTPGAYEEGMKVYMSLNNTASMDVDDLIEVAPRSAAYYLSPSNDLRLSFTSPYAVEISNGVISLRIVNADFFFNIHDTSVDEEKMSEADELNISGVLGQTLAPVEKACTQAIQRGALAHRTNKNKCVYPLEIANDLLVKDQDLFGDEFTNNKYRK